MIIPDSEYRILRDYLLHRAGVFVGDRRSREVDEKLSALAEEVGHGLFGDFCVEVLTAPCGRYRDRLLDVFMDGETSWFRDPPVWESIRNGILPTLFLRLRRNPQARIRMLSVGCSTGQEPFSMAMELASQLASRIGRGLQRERFDLVALDPLARDLWTGTSGWYRRDPVSEGLNEELGEQFFEERHGAWVLAPDLCRRVLFRRWNLNASFAALGLFDVVFLRNVQAFFTDYTVRTILRNVVQVMFPGGYLILGLGESLPAYGRMFDQIRQGAETVYFRLRRSG